MCTVKIKYPMPFRLDWRVRRFFEAIPSVCVVVPSSIMAVLRWDSSKRLGLDVGDVLSRKDRRYSSTDPAWWQAEEGASAFLIFYRREYSHDTTSVISSVTYPTKSWEDDRGNVKLHWIARFIEAIGGSSVGIALNQVHLVDSPKSKKGWANHVDAYIDDKFEVLYWLAVENPSVD